MRRTFLCVKFSGMLLLFLQGVLHCFLLYFSIFYVKLNYLQNTGNCSVTVAPDIVSWSGFQLRNELSLGHFTTMENVRRIQCENSEPFLAETTLHSPVCCTQINDKV